jgi:O-antigen/teichoic acid export membrane protein
MGIVIKQSFWSTFWAYFGVIIGFVNTLILRPAFFTEAEIGITTLVLNNALMIAPFVTLGMPLTFLRYFPELRDDEAIERKVLSLQFGIIILSNLIFCFFVFLLSDWIEQIYIEKSPEYNQYIAASLLIMVFFSLFMQLHSFSRSRLQVIIPDFLKEVFLRLGNIILILLFSWKMISFYEFIYGLGISYGSATLILVFYILKNQKISLTWNILHIPSEWKRKLLNFGSHNLLLAGSGSIYSNVGYSMIPAMVGAAENGVFVVCWYIGMIVEMPRRSLSLILSPIIGQEFKINNFAEIDNLYKKASINLSVVGVLFTIGILSNLNDLFSIIPNGKSYATGFYVVALAALAKVIDMAFSLNSDIINYSKFYKYNLYFFIFTCIITVALNYLLLPVMGISGVALSFLIATLLFNISKLIFIKAKFNMIPFTKAHLSLLLIASILFSFFWYVPLTPSPLINIPLKSILISVIYLYLIYKFRISEDIYQLINSLLKKYLNINVKTQDPHDQIN